MATTREPYGAYSSAPPTAPFGDADTYEPDLYPGGSVGTWNDGQEPAGDYQPPRPAKSRASERELVAPRSPGRGEAAWSSRALLLFSC